MIAGRLAFVFLILMVGDAASAEPSKSFIEARTAFRSGQYKEAAILFGGLLYPTKRLRDNQEVIDAHLHLAVANFEIGQKDSATREFEAALNLDPALDISTYGFSNEATDFFRDRKKDWDKKAREVEERTRRARLRRAHLRAVDRIRIYERKNYMLNLVPFGVGQFQNDQPTKGVLFVASQAGFAATSFVIWSYLRGRYPDGQVPITEVDAARRLQVFQITSALFCLGSMGWGVIDGFANYSDKPRPLTEDEKRDYVDELMREESNEDGRESSLRLTPMITPDGAGAALSWEF
jgi:tetratricopeptide (TPR) repeat protein